MCAVYSVTVLYRLQYLPASIFDKAHVCKHSLANVTAEAVRVPTIVHGLNDTANDELPWKKDMERSARGVKSLTFIYNISNRELGANFR